MRRFYTPSPPLSTSTTVAISPPGLHLATLSPSIAIGSPPSTDSADWTKRSTMPGVVWAHNFDTAAEVDNFRWANGVGNQPVVGTGDGSVTWNASDGFAGGGSLKITVPNGGQAGSEWHRPMSALTAASVGRPSNDLAVGGTTPVRTLNHTAGTDEGYNFRTGLYAPQTEQTSVGTTWQGNTDIWDGLEFWLQVRIKFTASRWQGGTWNGSAGSGNPPGKLIFIDVMPLTGYQEIVVRSPAKYSWDTATGAFDMYTVHGSYYGGFLGEPQGQGGGSATMQPGGNRSNCTLGHSGVQDCWEYPTDEWVTLLFHVLPGKQNDFLNPPVANILSMPFADTAIEVWIARATDTSYTKIWEKFDYRWYYDSSATIPNAFNGIKFAAYMNGVNSVTTWSQSYTQPIFSQQYIPCPGESAPTWWTS